MENPKVYIIDKNPRYREILKQCLENENYKDITQYECGESCYINHSMQADIIILDYNFGADSWSGLEFMEEYKRISPNTGFIFMSSDANINKAVETISKGAKDYILKSKTGLKRLLLQLDKSYHV
jgi:DNA-binding NtrC family response regulator